MSRRVTAVAQASAHGTGRRSAEVVLNGQDIDSEARCGGISADGSRRRYRPQAGCSADARPPPRTLPSSDQPGGCGRFGSGPSPSRQPMRSGRPTAVPCLGLESRVTNGLVQHLGVPVFGLAFVGGLPVFDSRQITASQRVLACCSACSSVPRAGSRCAVQIQKDLLGQTWLLLDQPRLDRHRLPAVPAGMTQENPGHERIVRLRQTSRPSSRLLNPRRSTPASRAGDINSRPSTSPGPMQRS